MSACVREWMGACVRVCGVVISRPKATHVKM